MNIVQAVLDVGTEADGAVTDHAYARPNLRPEFCRLVHFDASGSAGDARAAALVLQQAQPPHSLFLFLLAQVIEGLGERVDQVVVRALRKAGELSFEGFDPWPGLRQE